MMMIVVMITIIIIIIIIIWISAYNVWGYVPANTKLCITKFWRSHCMWSKAKILNGAAVPVVGIEALSAVASEPCVRPAVTITLLRGHPTTWHAVIISGIGLPTSHDILHINLHALRGIWMKRMPFAVIWLET